MHAQPPSPVRAVFPPNSARLASLDVLRALAALAVVACRVGLRLQREGGR